MFDFLEPFFRSMIGLSSGNEMISAIAFLLVSVVVLFVLRWVPDTIRDIIRGFLFVEITLDNYDEDNAERLKHVDGFLSRNTSWTKSTRFSLGNVLDQVTGRPATSLILGLGYHLILINEMWAVVHKTNSNDGLGMITLHIYTFWFNRILLDDLTVASSLQPTDSEIAVYGNSWGKWTGVTLEPAKSASSAILPAKVYGYFTTLLDDYFLSGNMHKRKLTLLVDSTASGTGRSTIARRLATQFKMPLYILDLNTVSTLDFPGLLRALPVRSLLLIEDLDSYAFASNTPTLATGETGMTLMGFTSALEGITNTRGIVTIVTASDKGRLSHKLMGSNIFTDYYTLKPLTDVQVKDFAMYHFNYSSYTPEAIWMLKQPLTAGTLRKFLDTAKGDRDVFLQLLNDNL